MSIPVFRWRSPHERFLFLLSPLLVIFAWVWVSRLGLFPDQILVPPQHVWEAALGLWESGELQMHLQQSLYRLVIGFSVGALLGVAFGILIGLSNTVENACSPLFHAIRQVPTVAFIPMLILVFGVEETFKIIIVAKAAFFPVALATHDAVRGIPKAYFEVARAYRLPTWLLVWRIILPSTVPPVLTGLRISLGRSWMVLVAAELLAADSGIGQMMEMGRQMFRIDIVMVGVFVTGLIGFSLDRLFRSLEGRLVKWKHQS
ncbi:MAG TPA: ABC transporter permease [Methylophilaceae bacterium]|jgi:sulfonate transport system permease protein